MVGAVQHANAWCLLCVTQRFHFANAAHIRIAEDVIYYVCVFVYYLFSASILLLLLRLLHINPCNVAVVVSYLLLKVFVVIFRHIIRLMTDFVSRFSAKRRVVMKFPMCAGSSPA